MQDFLAQRVLREDYLSKWQDSGLPLRRWLANGALFWAREALRKKHRSAPLDERALQLNDEENESPLAVLDKAFLNRLVHVSLAAAKNHCEAAQLQDHWYAFYQHHYLGRTFKQVAEDLGETAARATVMARTATIRFRHALHQGLKEVLRMAKAK